MSHKGSNRDLLFTHESTRFLIPKTSEELISKPPTCIQWRNQRATAKTSQLLEDSNKPPARLNSSTNPSLCEPPGGNDNNSTRHSFGVPELEGCAERQRSSRSPSAEVARSAVVYLASVSQRDVYVRRPVGKGGPQGGSIMRLLKRSRINCELCNSSRVLALIRNSCASWIAIRPSKTRTPSNGCFLTVVVCALTALMQVTSVSGYQSQTPLAEALKENPDIVQYWTPLQGYLTKYGYLSTSTTGADNLRTEDQLRESIKTMQRFGHIPPTGRVDAPTLELLQKKRCGMPDIIGSSERVKRYAIQGQSWQKTDLTWVIKDWASNIDPAMVKDELTKAFKVWSDVSKLTFTEVRSADADIVVSFLRGKHGDGYPFDGRGIVLAHAFFPGDGIGGDAHFDAEEPWYPGEPPPGVDGVSLFAVAAHEFGHSLGLSHSSVAGSLMNPFYQSIKDNFQLPHDDTMGIQALYGPKHPRKWVPLSPYSPTNPPTTTRSPYQRPTRPVYPRTTLRPRPGQPRLPVTTMRTITTTVSSKPKTCETTFDAISVIRRELFMFKGKYFWRLNDQGLMKDYPAGINRFWQDLDVLKIDAVYERPIDTKIVFFSGNRYWLFNGNVKERGYPRPLTDLGLPPDLDHIDAAMVWGYNGKTYLFSGKQYWRYDEYEGRVELDYPRDMSMWRGVPYNIDAAFQFTNGKTYFFKGRKFWEFRDHLMKVQKPSHVNERWFGCPSRSEKTPSSSERGEEQGKASHQESPQENGNTTLKVPTFMNSVCLSLIAVIVAMLLS